MNNLIVLGATGSIGRQTLEVADRLALNVVGLAGGTPSSAMAELALRHPEAALAVAGGSSQERKTFAGLVGPRVEFGSQAVAALAGVSNTVVMNGIVGSAGLASTVAALNSGNRVGLANKESLVVGGDIVKDCLAAGGGTLVPVDSEHSALHQLLSRGRNGEAASLVVTASGGPFRGRTRNQLDGVTPEQALAHPTWTMGGRITVDSATLANKGLEVIEANVLFGFDFDRIEVVIHPQSVVHSLVRMVDGSLLAHIGHTDMRVPIQYALTYPERADVGLAPFDLVGRDMTFEEPDLLTFPALALAYAAGRDGGSMPAVFNAADEVAVQAFLQGRLGFNAIPAVIEVTLETMTGAFGSTIEEVLEIDARARAVAASALAGAC